jgi:hypothetical protein
MTPMRRPQRFIALTVLAALTGVLGGCASGGSFDPSDMLDFLDTKKKLAGDRKPVFPEGVPGLQQGVPKELYRGNAQQPQQEAVAAASPMPAEEPKSGMRSAKSKGRPTTVGAAPAQEPAPGQDAEASAMEEEGAPAAVPAAPKPKKIARRRTTSLPNDEPAGQPSAQGAQRQAQPAGSSFPAPVPSGTFQR